MKVIIYLNFIISLVFTLCYLYQGIYVIIGLMKSKQVSPARKHHSYGIVISARNEAGVIGNLIQSIKGQSYPAELIDIYVVADNCTDNTAEVARQFGAIVYERFNNQLVGKGYALDWLFRMIKENHREKEYDAYIIFDADNVIAPTFVEEMNKVFDQ